MEPARDFGPLALKAVREKMIQAGWCRSVINKRVARRKAGFAASSWVWELPTTAPEGAQP